MRFAVKHDIAQVFLAYSCCCSGATKRMTTGSPIVTALIWSAIGRIARTLLDSLRPILPHSKLINEELGRDQNVPAIDERKDMRQEIVQVAHGESME